MLHMQGKDVEELRNEADAVEELSRFVEAPIEKLDKR